MHLTINSEFQFLENSLLFRMEEINLWLTKNKILRDKCYQAYSSQHLFFINGQWLRLPDNLSNTTIEEKFVEVYNKLEEIKNLHFYENYFKNEIKKFNHNSKNQQWVNRWIKHNDKIANGEFFSFLIDYLDYDKNNNEYHLKLFFLNSNNLDLYIDRDDFTNTIEYLETFEKYCSP